MKKLLPILIFFLFILSCQKDDNSVINSSGTILKSIEYDRGDENLSYHGEPQSLTEDYFYDDLGNLTSMKSGDNVIKEISYDSNNQYNSVITKNTEFNLAIHKDSLVYNVDGNITKIITMSNDSSGFFILWTNNLVYNNDGKIEKVITYSDRTQKVITIDSFHWENNNIIQIDQFDENENLKHSFFRTYDDKNNYKKDLPRFATEFRDAYNANNVVEESFLDFSGILDYGCNPCMSEHKYNLDDYPTEIKSPYNSTFIKLTYQ